MKKLKRQFIAMESDDGFMWDMNNKKWLPFRLWDFIPFEDEPEEVSLSVLCKSVRAFRRRLKKLLKA